MKLIAACLLMLVAASLAFAQGIYSDSFETGDTSQWSNGAPMPYIGAECPDLGWAIGWEPGVGQQRLTWFAPCLGSRSLVIQVWTMDAEGAPQAIARQEVIRGVELDGAEPPYRVATIDAPAGSRVFLPQLRQWSPEVPR